MGTKKKSNTGPASPAIEIQPCGDYVLLQPDPAPPELEKEGSLYVPSRPAWERPTLGTVRAVGPGRVEGGKLVKPQVKVGDRVFYADPVSTEIRKNGESLKLIREMAIHAIIEDE